MFFSFPGSISHIFGVKYERLSVPCYALLTSGLENSETYLKL